MNDDRSGFTARVGATVISATTARLRQLSCHGSAIGTQPGSCYWLNRADTPCQGDSRAWALASRSLAISTSRIGPRHRCRSHTHGCRFDDLAPESSSSSVASPSNSRRSCRLGGAGNRLRHNLGAGGCMCRIRSVWKRGGGIRATSRAMKSSGASRTACVPSPPRSLESADQSTIRRDLEPLLRHRRPRAVPVRRSSRRRSRPSLAAPR
jgi:hypothetical protein